MINHCIFYTRHSIPLRHGDEVTGHHSLPLWHHRRQIHPQAPSPTDGTEKQTNDSDECAHKKQNSQLVPITFKRVTLHIMGKGRRRGEPLARDEFRRPLTNSNKQYLCVNVSINWTHKITITQLYHIDSSSGLYNIFFVFGLMTGQLSTGTKHVYAGY